LGFQKEFTVTGEHRMGGEISPKGIRTLDVTICSVIIKHLGKGIPVTGRGGP
jgi:hypothetical protein